MYSQNNANEGYFCYFRNILMFKKNCRIEGFNGLRGLMVLVFEVRLNKLVKYPIQNQ